MKIKLVLILAALGSAMGWAEVVTNAPPSTPPADATDVPAATNAPATKPAHKSARKKHAAKPAGGTRKTEKPVRMETAPLVVNEPAAARQDHVNVRGQAAINSEIVTHLKKGEPVLVLEEITLKHPKTDEPARWARIALPPETHVWVNSAFLDAGQTVKPAKLKVRAGAGENYSFIGLLHKGDAVKAIGTKGDWTEIEASTNAYGFVAAHLLEPKPPGAAPAEVAAAPAAPPVQSVVEPQPTAAPPVVTPPATNEPAPVTPPPTVATPATATANSPLLVLDPIPAPLPPPVEEPPAVRLVQRQGIVGGTVSIQAPSFFELHNLDNGATMDYLYTTTTNLDLRRYKGLNVLVQGEEGLDERWPHTPVLTIKKIQLVE